MAWLDCSEQSWARPRWLHFIVSNTGAVVHHFLDDHYRGLGPGLTPFFSLGSCMSSTCARMLAFVGLLNHGFAVFTRLQHAHTNANANANTNTPESGLDVDKLDYYQRDCFFTGISMRSVYSNLMDSAEVVRCDDGQQRVCYPEKCLEDVFHAFRTRFDLHNKVLIAHTERYIHTYTQTYTQPHTYAHSPI